MEISDEGWGLLDDEMEGAPVEIPQTEAVKKISQGNLGDEKDALVRIAQEMAFQGGL